MATFSNENAVRQAPYVRRVLPGGKEKYQRLPFDLVKYDDGSGTYVEPIPQLGLGALAPNFMYTWNDVNTAATEADFLIVDAPPFSGVTEIR